jgi:hypothetical protein
MASPEFTDCLPGSYKFDPYEGGQQLSLPTGYPNICPIFPPGTHVLVPFLKYALSDGRRE